MNNSEQLGLIIERCGNILFSLTLPSIQGMDFNGLLIGLAQIKLDLELLKNKLDKESIT